MAFDWGKFMAAVIPAGVSAAAAIAGNKARQGGEAMSRETIQGALQEALGAYAQAHGLATDINNWALNSSFAPLNFGYQQSRADLQNVLGMGQQLFQGGLGDISSILSPYTSAGKRGAEETNFLLYGQRPGASPAPAAPAPSAPVAPPFQPAAPQGQMPNMLAGGFNIAPPPSKAAPTAAPASTNMLGAFAPHLADNKVEGGKGSTIGGIAGSVAGNFLPGGGFLGGAAGAGIGSLIDRLTRRGREKEAGSDAIEEHSDWFWNEVVPTAQRENWSGDQLKQMAESGFGDYTNWINQNLKDKNVAQNSLTSQRAFFDAGLRSNPYTSQFYK